MDTADATQTRSCSDCGVDVTRQVPVLNGRPFDIHREWRCSVCEEAHFADLDRIRAERDQQDRDAAHERRVRRALEGLNPPAIFADATIAGMVPYGSTEQRSRLGRAVQVARRIVGEVSGGLIPPPLVAFLGGPGTGKTHLLWAIGHELAAGTGHTAKVVRLANMIRDIRGAWNDKHGPSEDERLARYIAPAFLGIDEVSRHAFYGQNIHQHLYDVINARLEAERPTVMTTNETEQGLADILGPALMDRLALGGIVEFGTESYRRVPRAA